MIEDQLTADGVPIRDRLREHEDLFRKVGEFLAEEAPGAHLEGEHVVETAIRVIAGQARIIRKMRGFVQESNVTQRYSHPIRTDGSPLLIAGCDCESCKNIHELSETDGKKFTLRYG